jgi:hypothetical protein
MHAMNRHHLRRGRGGKAAMPFDTDREAIETALGMIGLTPPEQARVVRIKNTLQLTELDCSEAMLSEVKAHNRLSPVTAPKAMAFDGSGNLPPF